MRVEFKCGQEVQAFEGGLWQIGVFIGDNEDGTFRIKIGNNRYDLRHFHVKENKPAFQKEVVAFGHKGARNAKTL